MTLQGSRFVKNLTNNAGTQYLRTMKKTLLLCFIHGFKVRENVFYTDL